MSDDSARDAAKINSGDGEGHAGLGLERDRRVRSEEREDEETNVTRTPRKPDPQPDSAAGKDEAPFPASDIPGNTSETGRGGSDQPEPSSGTGTRTIRPRSPIGPGCARTTATMFIATTAIVALTQRHWPI